MLCYQCEQTLKGTGCTIRGVCGKDSVTASLQDILIHAVKGISMYAHRAAGNGFRDSHIDRFMIEVLFTMVTNVNFDPDRLKTLILEADQIRTAAKELYQSGCADKNIQPETLSGPAGWDIQAALQSPEEAVLAIAIEHRLRQHGPDISGLVELVTYGLKGMAAYADHAMLLGQEDDSVYAFFYAALNYLAEEKFSVDSLVGYAFRCGQINIRVMELLDSANTGTYGHPKPTAARISAVKGKAILVSGHDLRDLELLLKQTEGTGINIYTHGEMLPALAYPELKKYKHLIGNYGSAWQNQMFEFDKFPGAILMTTNCIQLPRDSYFDRIFTSGLVAWPNVRHISDGDFSPVIEAALRAPGFDEDEPEKTITIGFGHNTVLGVADKVIEAVKSGAIKHFFLVGGCDGAKPGRNYYTEFAQAVPEDCLILTLACGKYRFNKLEFGDIGGIPRLLDIGQCNDAYSAVRIAQALAEAFETDINGLPLSFILSWYEQKAVCILLSLLYLGVRDIRIGPSLPAFITPPVLQVLIDKFNIMPIKTVQEDLQACLA